MIDNTTVIDVHNHIAKERPYAEKCHFQSAEQLLMRMDNNHIDISVVFPRSPIEITPEDFVKLNDYIIDAVKKYPDRLIGFCFVTPLHMDFAVKEIERCAEAGLKGIKLLPHKHGFYNIDGELMNPIMVKVQETNFVVLTHSDFNTKRCTPYQVVRLASRYPEVPIIMAHFGMDGDCIRSIPDIVKDTKNIYVDTSATPNMPEAIYARPIEQIPDKILFGSDTPTLSPEVELYKMKVAEELFGLTKENKRRILGENAARLFNI